MFIFVNIIVGISLFFVSICLAEGDDVVDLIRRKDWSALESILESEPNRILDTYDSPPGLNIFDFWIEYLATQGEVHDAQRLLTLRAEARRRIALAQTEPFDSEWGDAVDPIDNGVVDTALFARIDTVWRRDFFEGREERSAHVADMCTTNDEDIRKNNEPNCINPSEEHCNESDEEYAYLRPKTGVCPQCGLQCKNLERHIKRQHTFSKNYLCPGCKHAFRDQYGLRRHTARCSTRH